MPKPRKTPARGIEPNRNASVSLGAPDQDEIDVAWEEEVGRRLAAYDRGEMQAIDAEEVFARAALIAR